MVSEDTRGVLLAQLVPGSVGLLSAAAFAYDKDLLPWLKDLKKPSWAPSDMRCYFATEAITVSPLGCAAYLVFKHGGGFDDPETKTALALFGATHAAIALSLTQAFTRNLKGIFCTTLVSSCLMSATCYTFYKVHNVAGLMVAPFAAWLWFNTVLAKCDIDLNEKQQ